jgi:phospholipid/cholesterol/gamma-HCH transport system permease protein
VKPELAANASAVWDPAPAPDRSVVLRLHGRLDAAAVASLWPEAEQRGHGDPHLAGRLDVDVSAVEYCDGAGLAFLQCLANGRLTGIRARLLGLSPALEERLGFFSAEDYARFKPRPPEVPGGIADLGRSTRMLMADLREQIALLGAIAAAFPGTLAHRRTRRWREIRRVFELAGVNALPIISLMSLLVGFIIAFESASAFAMLGAQIYMADMLGLVLCRELGPLLTAVMVAGRSGSAFAAELGTMKINDELNALETMGLDPVRFLVVQRIVAAMLLTPLLTVYSILLGLGGGIVVMLSLGFPLPTILAQMRQSVGPGDLVLGTCKALVFGTLVATVGCVRGLQTARGPAAVGASTTRAVVAGILMVIAADAVFSVTGYLMR